MAKKKKKAKIRTEFRKRHESRTRENNWTRDFQQDAGSHEELVTGERLSGKGNLTRKRTIVGEVVNSDEHGFGVQLDVDLSQCMAGRVLSVHGLNSIVQTEENDEYVCAVRGLLKNLSTDQRHVVVAGDRVLFRPEGDREGVIERIEPRRGVISRTSRKRQHVLVANVDQLLIITSAAEPRIKPNLIDRLLVAAEKSDINPIICINKIDLVDAADLQPLVGVYGQMGYRVVFVSATTGFGIQQLKQLVGEKDNVVAGQSGVGKSSLLNAIEPGLDLRVNEVSDENQKGKHTTTTARLIPLSGGGHIVDTPGIRQFQLWDVIPVEVAGYFRDIRPFVSRCRFPNCTHTHEADCAVKDSVADGRIDARRYESYCRLVEGDEGR